MITNWTTHNIVMAFYLLQNPKYLSCKAMFADLLLQVTCLRSNTSSNAHICHPIWDCVL